MEVQDALRKAYRLRLSRGSDIKTLEVTFPYEVAEREARRYNMSVEAFLDKFRVVANYGGSLDGVLYTFEEIPVKANDTI